MDTCYRFFPINFFVSIELEDILGSILKIHTLCMFYVQLLFAMMTNTNTIEA